IVNEDTIFLRVNNPVFTDSRSAVFEQLCKIVHPPAARRDYFDNPVWSTCAAFVCELLRGAYNAYIRLDIVFIVFIQKYGKWGNIDLTGAFFLVDVVGDLTIEGSKYLLMSSCGRG